MRSIVFRNVEGIAARFYGPTILVPAFSPTPSQTPYVPHFFFFFFFDEEQPSNIQAIDRTKSQSTVCVRFL